jgi:hypothetical protein
MKSKHLFKFVKHFVSHVEPLKERPVVILDSNYSHLSTAALDYCKENNVTVFYFLPHCSQSRAAAA